MSIDVLKPASKPNMPILIAHSICDSDVGELGHDCPSSSIHKFERPLVVRFLEAIFCREPVTVRCVNAPGGVKPFILGESTAIYPDHDPCVWKEIVGLLELLYILEP